MARITPNLWFDTEGLDAAEFYVSLFPNSRVTNVSRYPESGRREAGTVMTVDFELDGQPYTALNGGPQFPQTEAFSLKVDCPDQDEVDRLWAALTEGGQESQCGWLKDRFGVSWQIVPAGLGELMMAENRVAVDAAMAALLSMTKLDIGAMRAAVAAALAATE